MLASEVLSIGIGTPLTEEMVAFTCDRCGQTTNARDASITRQGTEVKYACPHDGTSHGSPLPRPAEGSLARDDLGLQSWAVEPGPARVGGPCDPILEGLVRPGAARVTHPFGTP